MYSTPLGLRDGNGRILRLCVENENSGEQLKRTELWRMMSAGNLEFSEL